MNGSYIECVCYSIEKNSSGFNYFPQDQRCSIFVTFSKEYTINTITNATFYFFQLPSIEIELVTTRSMSYGALTSKNDTVVGIWNGTADGNSLVVSMGPSNGQYPVAQEGPASVNDFNLGTKYNSYGSGNVSNSREGAGIGTGFNVIMSIGSCLVTGIQFGTANDASERDPLTMTLEGSNIVDSLLLLNGSSWTLIYNGSTGIANTTTRSIYITPQNFTNTIWYRSYRFLMTSQRGISTNLQYSEAHLLGFGYF